MGMLLAYLTVAGFGPFWLLLEIGARQERAKVAAGRAHTEASGDGLTPVALRHRDRSLIANRVSFPAAKR